ncbi:hypothetical protein MHBO_002373 [Bonamia ostreae]|uniref:Uncharacterized protein n=1 Tax=Bonamia ostreae TaxID=126728 RepID=A0ABV2AM19_9EUKA
MLSSKLDDKSSWEFLSDETKSLGQKLRVIKKNCKSENRGFVVVKVAFNCHLGIGRLLTRLQSVHNLIKESKLCQMTLVNFKERCTMPHDGEFPHAKELLLDLENVLKELGPLGDDFVLRVSKLTTAVEDILLV